jgi:Cys-tRNA(Pro) deacylase
MTALNANPTSTPASVPRTGAATASNSACGQETRLIIPTGGYATAYRKLDTVPLKEVQPLTGYVRGGVTVLGAKKAYPVYVDETIELFDVVSISAGRRGLQILLSPAAYLAASGARLGPIAAAE